VGSYRYLSNYFFYYLQCLFYLCTKLFLNDNPDSLCKLLKGENNIFRDSFLRLLSNKSNLFLILSISVLTIVIYPIIMPHLTHPSMIYHIILHMISFDVALFLTTISFISFKKTMSKKILFTALSFGFLLCTELLYLLQSSNLLGAFYIPLIEVEFPHVLLLIMLGLFAAGVLRIERK
jgi:hypothetical protein